MSPLTVLEVEGVPWVEKYRGHELEEIKDQDVAVKIARGFIKRGMPMHLILHGPAGTGKTTLARIIAERSLGRGKNANILEINASDQLRMDYVRSGLKDFVMQSALGVELKAVILDEADNIPSVVQNTLRRLMEKHSRNCRFIFICNHFLNLISPIQSRCAVIRFKPLSANGMSAVISRIISEEGLDISVEAGVLAEELRRATQGDMRLAINALQACDVERPVESIYEMLGIVRPLVLDSIYSMLRKGNLDKILKTLNVMGRISPHHFMTQLGDHIIRGANLSDGPLARVCRIIADYDERLTLAGDQEIQLIGMLAKLIRAMEVVR